MRIIVACISLALVACTHGQTTSNIDNLQFFGPEGSGQRVRRGVGGSGKAVAGFYIPANSGGVAGSSKSQVRSNSANYFNILGTGSSATTLNLPGPKSLPVSSSSTSYAAPVSSGGTSNTNFQAWGGGSKSVIQGSAVHTSGYNLQVSSGGNSGNNVQSWSTTTGGQSNQGSTNDNSYQGWVPIAGEKSYRPGKSGARGFRSSATSSGTPSTSSELSVAASNKGWNAGASSLPEPIGSASSPSTRYGTPSVSGNNYGSIGGGSYQGWGIGAGSHLGSVAGVSNSLLGPIGQSGTVSLQGYSKGHVASKGIVGHSIHGSSLQGIGVSEYHAVPVGFQTTEGRYVSPDLLDQVQTILLREEGVSGYGGGSPSASYGVPSSAYGVPSVGLDHGRSGRVVGITLEGTDQSVQIAQFHQTTSGFSFFGGGSKTLAIPTGSFGVPHH